MKQKINYKYVCLLMMLITVCLFGCSQTVMAAADGSITCGLSKESRSSAVVQKSRHTSNEKLYKSRQEEIVESKVMMDSMKLFNALMAVSNFLGNVHTCIFNFLVGKYRRGELSE